MKITKQGLEEWVLLNGKPSLHDIKNDISHYSESEVVALIMKLLNELNRKL